MEWFPRSWHFLVNIVFIYQWSLEISTTLLQDMCLLMRVLVGSPVRSSETIGLHYLQHLYSSCASITCILFEEKTFKLVSSGCNCKTPATLDWTKKKSDCQLQLPLAVAPISVVQNTGCNWSFEGYQMNQECHENWTKINTCSDF